MDENKTSPSNSSNQLNNNLDNSELSKPEVFSNVIYPNGYQKQQREELQSQPLQNQTSNSNKDLETENILVEKPENLSQQNQFIENENVTKNSEMKESEINSQDTVSENTLDEYEIPTVRTYKGDIDQTVKSDKINVAKVMIAEQKKRENKQNTQEKYSIKNPVNKFKLFFSFVLIGLAIVAVIWVTYNFVIPRPVENEFFVQNSGEMFVSDKKVYVDLQDKNLDDFKSDINNFLNGEFPAYSLNEIIFYKSEVVNEETINKIMPVNYFVNSMSFDMPTNLIRSFSKDYMIGIYSHESQNKPFIVFKLADYPSAFESIFNYEGRMVFNIRNYFGGFTEFESLSDAIKRKNDLMPEENINSTTTVEFATSTDEEIIDNSDIVLAGDDLSASSTVSTSTQELLNVQQEIQKLEEITARYSKFIDVVLSNTNSRAVFDADSNVLLYYTFIDREWLLFANDIEVLKEVKRRIREKNLSK